MSSHEFWLLQHKFKLGTLWEERKEMPEDHYVKQKVINCYHYYQLRDLTRDLMETMEKYTNIQCLERRDGQKIYDAGSEARGARDKWSKFEEEYPDERKNKNKDESSGAGSSSGDHGCSCGKHARGES